MKHPIRAAIYCRVATPDQLSLDRQAQRVCDYAKAKGYEISSITLESCKGTTLSRPGIQKVLSDEKNGAMDVLLVNNVSRIGRNMAATMRFIQELGAYSVVVEVI